MIRPLSTHEASHHGMAGRFFVLVGPPRKGGRGLTVSGRIEVIGAPRGELARLKAAGWRFKAVQR